ncbi:RagB/SusD family nutrient uptake outer membrane protein [Chryseobacterium gambrini]|uniref:RagB/SusD family nutrient uptake outer membrane protein n=1 Tax=Chryseobacterium gambrini TaxID=373672 RepID=A0AAJ1VJ77_9FLAO|nr:MULTISPECIES: RagB/SusD family nutrient uptake outer membrane protein [Chryseobacterium]MDN4011491.1 RagB/SusD family nutrient uptake outer membrane protein [Chryseobacterium gambrini]QWA38258.1 RagB/SusD family nutrient uptake outer membrane protein [Chryseobacterium sp. ZHDP1]
MKKILFNLFTFLIILLTAGCSKQWLEDKQDVKLIVPTTLNDLDLLLNADLFQYDGRGGVETSCDDYEFTSEQFNEVYFGFDRDFIIWKKEKDYENLDLIQQNEWNCAYSQIQVCNVVIKGLSSIDRTGGNGSDYDRIQGVALYHRAKQFLNMVMTFSKYYDKTTANSDLGIPIKLEDDIDEKVKRASVEETYQQIVKDLQLSARVLPATQSDYTRVTKAGAFALLARTFLFMDKYGEAKDAADSTLKYNSFVEDFNLINDPTTSNPLDIKSKEIHVRSLMVKSSSSPSIGRINNTLYNGYGNDDLRKSLFFKEEGDGKFTFRGEFLNNLFTGTTTGEILLILSEANARLNNVQGAMDALNKLASKRYKKETFQNFAAQNASSALDLILKERRKELVTRGLRWQDLKRLNRDPKYSQTLIRQIGDETYTLPPNDPRYVLPIPQFVINFNHIEQNQY